MQWPWILSLLFEGEAAQIALENKQDCVCIQATKEEADKIIQLFNIQLQREISPMESEAEKQSKQYPLRSKQHKN